MLAKKDSINFDYKLFWPVARGLPLHFDNDLCRLCVWALFVLFGLLSVCLFIGKRTLWLVRVVVWRIRLLSPTKIYFPF